MCWKIPLNYFFKGKPHIWGVYLLLDERGSASRPVHCGPSLLLKEAVTVESEEFRCPLRISLV